jgi:hypothetical protein
MDTKKYIKNCVNAYGCIPIDAATLAETWPDRGYGVYPWDHEALDEWCLENRIEQRIDFRKRIVTFTPAGIYVPMFA